MFRAREKIKGELKMNTEIFTPILIVVNLLVLVLGVMSICNSVKRQIKLLELDPALMLLGLLCLFLHSFIFRAY